jgi:hypothetical protein
MRAAGNTNCHRHSVAAFRQNSSPQPARQIDVMHLTHPRQVSRQRLPCSRRQHRHPILSTLPLPHDDLLAIEVEILDPKLETFFQPEPGTV